MSQLGLINAENRGLKCLLFYSIGTIPKKVSFLLVNTFIFKKGLGCRIHSVAPDYVVTDDIYLFGSVGLPVGRDVII